MIGWTEPWLLGTPLAEWVAFICGVIGVWLSIRERVAAWPLLLVSTAIYIVYAFLFSVHVQAVNLIVYFGLCLFGWWSWARSGAAGGAAMEAPLVVRRPSRRVLAVALALWLGLTAGAGVLLGIFDGSRFPYLESFILCGGLIAQWMVARKYLACWAAWIAVNVATIALYLTLAMTLTAVLYLLFLGLALYGWWDWARKIRRSAA